ncbi:hypothetical protein BCR34DRAFT_377844 [Clohesyomyces aquaticus]|uniref:Uncharacterized protein n=1 Tax=Clohesyomyces aquaticus TaxID=1231657 RepID=A0A1Y2A643_9PLEO|nr:hypothetical protein BCR34DRAFT_377844 [Clohesyomyces aquaticus]
MFMVVHMTSTSGAGYRLLPITLCMSVGLGFTGGLMHKKHVLPFSLLVLEAVLQILGMRLMMQLQTVASGFQVKGYGFEAILGLELGTSSATTVMSAVLVFRPEYLAVGMGGIAQFRTLGGCTGISICINIINKYTAADLALSQLPLSAAQIKIIQVSASIIDGFTELVKTTVKSFARSFLRQAGAMTAFSGMEFLVSFVLLEKLLRR